jgi:CspA family cold shock protein
MEGKVIKFIESKGYGFIRPQDSEDDIFFHYTQIKTDKKYKKLNVGDVVEFESGQGPNGPQANSIVLVESAMPRERR